MNFQSGFTAVWSAGGLVALLMIGFAGLLWASVAFETWLDDTNEPGPSTTSDLLGEPAPQTSQAA